MLDPVILIPTYSFILMQETQSKIRYKENAFSVPKQNKDFLICDAMIFNVINIHNSSSKLTLYSTICPIEVSYISSVFCEC